MNFFQSISTETLILWAIVGFISGVIAKIIMPGKDKGGIITTTILGILGSFLGAYLGKEFGIYSSDISEGISFISVITAIAGSFILLLFFKVIRIIF